MASSSSSPPSLVFDVFLSFMGRDTRKGFTFELYLALKMASLIAFMDELPVGQSIIPQLLTAIERSRISVIVLSPNYASSPWCLKELAYIMQCWKTQDQLVLPVFYDVDPSDVRKQKGSFADALEKHAYRFEGQELHKWREALTQAANICGWDTKNERNEGDLIDNIVKCIRSKGLPTRLNISIYPLRYDICDEYLNAFLQAGSQDVVTVGICGPSQMGK